jgi:hypothetical protein
MRDPGAEFCDPSSEFCDPSADFCDPSAEFCDPSAEFRDPSSEFGDSSAKFSASTAEFGKNTPSQPKHAPFNRKTPPSHRETPSSTRQPPSSKRQPPCLSREHCHLRRPPPARQRRPPRPSPAHRHRDSAKTASGRENLIIGKARVNPCNPPPNADASTFSTFLTLLPKLCRARPCPRNSIARWVQPTTSRVPPPVLDLPRLRPRRRGWRGEAEPGRAAAANSRAQGSLHAHCPADFAG